VNTAEHLFLAGTPKTNNSTQSMIVEKVEIVSLMPFASFGTKVLRHKCHSDHSDKKDNRLEDLPSLCGGDERLEAELVGEDYCGSKKQADQELVPHIHFTVPRQLAKNRSLHKNNGRFLNPSFAPDNAPEQSKSPTDALMKC
jgi:hypothetical protein